MDVNYRDFGTRILELLNDSGMTLKELAEAAQITEQSLSRYVEGRRLPGLRIIVRMADTLQTTTDYLLRGMENFDTNIVGDTPKGFIEVTTKKKCGEGKSFEHYLLLNVSNIELVEPYIPCGDEDCTMITMNSNNYYVVLQSYDDVLRKMQDAVN